MSEDAKTAELTRKAQEASQAAQTGLGSAQRAARTADGAADRAKQVGQAMNEAAAETASAAVDMASKATASGRDAIQRGVQAAGEAGGRVADIGFDRGHHLVASTVQALDIYADATERSAERVQALVSSAMIWTRGVQKMQHAWMELIDASMKHAAHRPQDLLRCKTLAEVADVQRDLYTGAINYAFDSSARLFDLASKAMQEAARPLQAPRR